MEEDLARYAGQIEELCTAGGATPAALDPPSRRTYCWLKFLTAPENLTAHLNALALGREVASAWRLRPGQQLSLHLINMHSLWRARQSSDQLLVRVTEGFINADRAVWQAIMKQILAGSCAESRQMVDEFTETEQFTDVSYEIDALAAPPSLPTKGRVHDLAESFERVNGQYFGGRLARPKLTWNQTLTVRKFGHYQPSRDTIMISASLDSDRVPAFALDFVMYHEMLHKWHGIMYLNGRRVAHSGAFREDERRYPRWQEAERVLAAIHSGQ